MSDVKMGQLLDASAGRDAVHVAIAPVIAAHILKPGEHVGLIGDEDEPMKVGRVSDKIGIVDPFLVEPLMPGQRFYLFLYPNTVTSLRHVWAHPAFPDQIASVESQEPRAVSERWIRAYAEEVGVSYRICMDAADDYLASVDRHPEKPWSRESHILGYDTPGIVHAKKEEFWKHYEVVTGKKVDNHKATFFSCSC